MDRNIDNEIMKSVITIVFLLGCCAPVFGEVDESRLLQEWGMRWNSDGKLELAAPVPTRPYQEWTPQMSGATQSVQQQLPAIQPIVIRPH